MPMIVTRTVFTAALMAIASLTSLFAGKSSTPTPRDVEFDWMSIAAWYRQHADDVEVAAKGEAKLLFVGDSIIQGWEWTPSWKKHFEQYSPANFAIGGDKTQNLLWRLQNGGVGKLDPKAIVILVGVNNFGHDNATPEEVVEGVSANLDFLKKAFPNAKVLALTVFPWGEKPDDYNRERAKAASKLALTLADERVTVLDIGHIFLEKDGTIKKEIMGDFLHPTPEGYVRATNAILPTLKGWLDK